MGENEKYDRRSDTVERLSALDERTHHITKAVDRIEKALESHTKEEEMAFHGFYQTKAEMWENLANFKDEIFTKIDETVNPVKDEYKRIHTIYKVLAVLSGIAVLLLSLVKDDYDATKGRVSQVEQRQHETEQDVTRLNTRMNTIHSNDKSK